MALLVLDTSVLLKWFKEEKYSEISIEIKEGFVEGAHEIVIPDLVLYEITNAMRYSEAFDPELTKKFLDSFIDLGIDIVTPTHNLLNSAIDLSDQYEVTLYDAIFLSLAKLIDGVFITADEKLYEKVKGLQFTEFISGFD